MDEGASRTKQGPLDAMPPLARLIGWIPCTLLLLGLAGPAAALDPATPIAQYRSRTWKQRDGLPQNSAVDIAQDSRGYLWVATFGGLARFNGHGFRDYPPAEFPSLPTNRTLALCPEPGEGLWVGMENKGVVFFKDGNFAPCPDFEGLRHLHGICFARGRPGQVFVGTDDGVFELREGGAARRWSERDGLPEGPIPSLLRDPDGTLWIGTADGLFRLRGGSVERVSGDLPRGAHVFGLARRRDGSLWVGAADGLFRLDGDAVRAARMPAGLPRKGILRILEDRDGSLWIGYRGSGLARLRGDRAETYTVADGLPSDIVLALYEDREGSLWIGTDGGGLHQLTNTAIQAYGSPKVALSGPVRCVLDDGSGGFWIGTRGEPFRGLAHLTERGVDFLADRFLAEIPGILSLHLSTSGTLWIGCENIGLYLLKEGKFSPGPALPESSADVLSFAESGRGTLLIGTGAGLFELNSEGAIPRPVPGTETLAVQAILVAGDATWLATTSGLHLLSPSGIRKWDRSNSILGENVRALYRDASGILWIGTYGEGLYRLAGERLTRFGPENGLPAATISFLTEDPFGRLWMSDNDGIFGVPKRQLDGLAQGDRAPLGVTHLTEEDGMLVRECNGGSQPAGLLTASGDIVAATINGIVLVHPERRYPNPIPPPVFIEGLRVGGKEVGLSGRILLPPSSRNIEIRCAALTYLDPARVRYRIRLEGSDPGWIDAGNRGDARYAQLRPGRYVFRVTADNASGIWSREGASVAFRVLPHSYQTWWFFGVCGIALALATAFAIYLRTRSLERRRGNLEALVQTRTAQLAEARGALEVKVQERTSDLESARKDLEGQLEKTRAAHLALEESEERFRSVFDNAPVGIFRASFDGTLLMANRALASMLGASSPSLLSGLNLCRDQCRRGGEMGSCLPGHASDATPYVHEAEWRRFDGTPLWVRVHVKPSRPLEGGMPLFEGTVEDITAIRQAQERLRILETAIESMDLGMVITGLDRKILYCNPSEARMHGFTVDALLGQDARMLGLESQQHDLGWGDPKALRVFRREVLNRKIDGTLFPVFLTSVPVVDAEGRPFCLITTCQDLTESKRRDSQLQEALRDAVVGKLAAVVAHQVNTPLAAMKTRLEMLREDTVENEDTQRSIESLMKQVDRVAQTVRALLGFVRQRSVGEGISSLEDILGSVTHLFEGVFQSKGIALEVSLPPGPIRVQGSIADLQEVFLNLFENFREALGRGNRVAVSARVADGHAEIRMEDDGPGLGPDPERVFEPFYTTKSSGTGLGLAICRNICTACGGRMTAENRPPEQGGGARFIIILPISETTRSREEAT